MRRLLIICALLAAPLTVMAQPASVVQQFDRGTAALTDGHFQEALEAFQQVEAAGWGSAELYYNTGLAHYRMDHLGQAIRYLEKARYLDDDNERILHSLSVAERRRTDRFSQLPAPFWKNVQAWLVKVVPIRPAFLIGLLAWFGFVAGWTWSQLSGGDTALHHRLRQAAAITGAVFLIHALASSIWPAHPDRSVILVPSVVMHEQANDDAAPVLTVHEGLVVERRSESTEWTFIEVPNGTRGWVHTRTLGDI